MNRLKIILLLITITTFSTNAQILKAGVLSSTMTYDYAYGNTTLSYTSRPQIALFAGVGYKLPLVPFVDLLIEAGYEQNRSVVDLPIFGENMYFETFHVKVDYISFNILPRVNYNIPFFQFYAMAGPQFEVQLPQNPKPVDDNSTKDFLGVTMAGGVELNILSPLVIGLEARYHPIKQTVSAVQYVTVSKDPSVEYALTLGLR